MADKDIVAFDFDGTLTNKDSMLEFIKYTKGSVYFYLTFLLFSPLLFLYIIGLYPNWKIKEILFSFLYKGENIDSFKKKCEHFFLDRFDSILKRDIKKCIKEYKNKGATIIIVSASVENWIAPFAQYLSVDVVIGTKIEVVNGVITGKFSTKNCYGYEKVSRIKELFPNRNTYRLVAYGDSSGDKDLLKFADVAYYKFFK